MGLKPSPYVTIKAFFIAFEIVLGNRRDPGNVYHWSEIRLNLPGMPLYDPSRPKVVKYNPITEKVAPSTLVYVDDLRSVGSTASECWLVMHRTASILTHLGIQVAARKTRPPTPTPGPWAGSVAWSSEEGVCVKSTKEKWVHAQGLVQRLQQELQEHSQDPTWPGFVFKTLERTRGFLVHMQRAYPSITPYLKGIHLTLDSWRPGRGLDGWKQQGFLDSDGYWSDQQQQWISWVHAPHSHPEHVKPVDRLRDDLEALRQLLSGVDPPLRFVRRHNVCVAVYGFVDASGEGFGGTLHCNQEVSYLFGLWGKDQDSNSSNFRELSNLVFTLEHGVENGSLCDSEVFLFTDNSTAESVFYKGSSSSKLLFDLVVLLRKLELQSNLLLSVYHVSGQRMVAQGTDGLSRGDLNEGVMAGHPFLSFIPLHLDAIARQPAILDWLRHWVQVPDLSPLSPEEWFNRGHGYVHGSLNKRGLWFPIETGEPWVLWSPPPAAADTAIDELLLSRHKRTHINHLFIVPRLATQSWRKKLFKVCDHVFEIPAGSRSF
jgi:hypothetical protein